MSHNYTIDEQETIINMLPATVSKQAEIYSCVPQMVSRLRKLAEDNPKDVAIMEDDGAVTATVPLSWIKIAPKIKRQMTEEQRQANIERLARYREAMKK